MIIFIWKYEKLIKYVKKVLVKHDILAGEESLLLTFVVF